MKKVAIIGGAGTIGTILREGLKNEYRILIMDKEIIESTYFEMVQADAANYNELLGKIPNDTDVIINLLATETEKKLEEIEKFNVMTEIFLKASYYILDAASKLGISKVIFASSNHVTDFYEENGVSLLGRPITVKDYPYSKGLYGVLKLASENFGHIFAQEKNLSVINLRIASVPKGEKEALQKKGRILHTLLTRIDVVHLFKAAIEAKIPYGTYYGVSDNPEKPWDTKNASLDLGFQSKRNSTDILKEIE